MMKRFATVVLALLIPVSLFADVAMTERASVAKRLHNRAANRQKKTEAGGKTHPGPRATGSLELVDSSGLQYFINTNITFSSSSEVSGAASEASYSQAVHATTLNGGTTSSTLNDEFDSGFGGFCLSTDGSAGPCETENSSYQFYNQTGSAPSAEQSCNSRQYDFPAQTLFGNIRVQKKVLVPTNDTFIRFMNIFTNTGATPITFKVITTNNLGSDNNTVVVSSSNGNAVAEPSDTSVSSFQAYSATTSGDVRTGVVLQGPGAPTPVQAIHYVNGDDNPYWSYQLTLAPGQTKIIMNFATGAPSKAAANAQAARLVGLPDTATQCITGTELTELSNFLPANVVGVPALSPLAALFATIFLGAAGLFAFRLRG